MRRIKNLFKNLQNYFWLYSFLFFLLFILIFSDPIGKKLKVLLLPKPHPKPFIADILDFKGKIHWRPISDVSFHELKPEKKVLHHLDRLRLKKNSHLLLGFLSGYKIKILGESEIFLEYWDLQDTPVYLHLLYGSFDLKAKGERGKLFIVNKGKTFTPTKNLPSPQNEINSLSLPFVSLNEPTSFQSIKSNQLTLSTSLEKSKELRISDDNLRRKNSKTLTNALIEKKIRKFRHKFKKCQWNTLRNKEKADGEILLGLLIEPSGKVKNFKLIQSSLQSKNFEHCILTVLKSISFRPFRGSSIYATYPLEFKSE